MILIIDDDPSVTASLTLLFKQAGYGAQSAASPPEALDRIEREPFDLVFLDMNYSRQTTGEEGLELLSAIKSRKPEVPVILITAWGSISLAVAGMKAGAADFITKPWSNDHLLQSAKTALSLVAATPAPGQETPTREVLDAQYDFQNVVGQGLAMRRILDLVGRVSATDASVLITGESGTGKECIAEAIHQNSKRKNGPFVKVNLGGISSTLFESEMFGHVKGAFTDARQSRKGRFEMADGGTVFLDEIGDLDLNCQVKLLRVLQDRTYEVLGSSTTRTVDIRVVSATNRNLSELVGSGDFREDLLYRLNLIVIHLPPLRERPEDIPLLATHFLNDAQNTGTTASPSVGWAALEWLQKQDWPGNVRQLKQLIERTLLITNKDVLTVESFELALKMQPEETGKDLLPPVGSLTLDEMEKAMIVKCMARFEGNISKVAEALGLSRGALYRRLERYGIQP